MKLSIKNGLVVAQPETKEDLELLLGNSSGIIGPRHKSKKWKRECPHCGKLCKGKKGLAVHFRLMHSELKA